MKAILMTILKTIAWIGLGFFAAGTAISFWIWMALINYDPGPTPGFGPEAYWLYIIPIDILGLLLMYIGGLITRARRLWLASIIIGVLHIAVSVPPQWSFLVRLIKAGMGEGPLTFFVLPGLLAILLGIILLIIDKKVIKKKQKEV